MEAKRNNNTSCNSMIMGQISTPNKSKRKNLSEKIAATEDEEDSQGPVGNLWSSGLDRHVRLHDSLTVCRHMGAHQRLSSYMNIVWVVERMEAMHLFWGSINHPSVTNDRATRGLFLFIFLGERAQELCGPVIVILPLISIHSVSFCRITLCHLYITSLLPVYWPPQSRWPTGVGDLHSL